MKNILLVDDDQTSTFLSTKALERMDNVNDIHTACNGEQALALFKNFYHQSSFFPDIVLLDLNMPIMDGFDFLKAFADLKLVNKDKISVIVVTSSVNPEDIKRAKALGAADYVSKPLTLDRLKSVLAMPPLTESDELMDTE